MNDLDERLEAAAADLWDHVASFELTCLPRRRARMRPVAVVAAALLVGGVIAAGVITVVQHDAPPPSDRLNPSPTTAITVTHERVEFSVDVALTCVDPLDLAGTFDTFVVDSWADEAGKRWRNTITYPDGRTRDVANEGQLINPTGIQTRGDSLGAVPGCTLEDGRVVTFAGEPSPSHVYLLNHATDPGGLRNTSRDLATKQPGSHPTSRTGQLTDLWIAIEEGPDHTGDGRSTFEQRWHVDAEGRVQERQAIYSSDALGRVTWVASLTSHVEMKVHGGFFDLSQPDPATQVPDAIASGPISVVHERAEVSIDADLTCPPIDEPERFESAVIESWSDRDGRRWRTTITFPDGQTYDTVALGSYVYPPELRHHGDDLTSVPGCLGPDGSELRFTVLTGVLNAADEANELERPYTMDFLDQAESQPGTHHDSRGRPAGLWRHVITGYTGYGDDHEVPLTQTTEWYVDPGTGRVIERRFTNALDTVGTVTSTVTQTDHDTVTVPADFFDIDDPDPESFAPPPGGPPADLHESAATAPSTMPTPP